jgi:sugar lactone lactonase YvrE
MAGSGGSSQVGHAGTDAAAGSTAQGGAGGGAAGTGGAAQGGSGGTTAPPTDCDNLPPLPILEVKVLAHVPAVEDFTFDSIGNLVAVSTSNELFRCPYSGTPQVVLPNVSPSMGSGIVVRGTRFLDADSLVYADIDNSLVRLNLADLSKDILLNGLVGPNGVVVGMDGLVYITESGGRVRQVDASAKTTRTLLQQDMSLDGITFNADYSRLYFNSESGSVSYIPFNPDGTTGERVPVAEHVALLLDGMTADECGNVYTVQMAGVIFRIAPDGQRQEVVDLNDLVGSYEDRGLVNAVNFGSGLGGWKADALYISSMAGSAYEVVVGVKGAAQPHLP